MIDQLIISSLFLWLLGSLVLTDWPDSGGGHTRAYGAQQRDGFKQLLANVALGEVGIVLSRELSRLSRTDVGADFCIGPGSCSACN